MKRTQQAPGARSARRRRLGACVLVGGGCLLALVLADGRGVDASLRGDGGSMRPPELEEGSSHGFSISGKVGGLYPGDQGRSSC